MNRLLSTSFSIPAVAALLSLAGSGCRPHADAHRHALPPEAAARLLLDRNWLDRLPDGPRDRLHVFRFVPRMGGGVYQDRTLFAGQFELFTFSHDGTSILFRLHHTGDEVRVPYTIETIDGEGLPFELHLHLADSPRGPSDYYSSSELGGGDLDARLGAVLTAHAR